MKESHNEGIASHIGPESCGGVREGGAEALTGGGMDWVLSLENVIVRSADGFVLHGRQDRHGRHRKTGTNSAWSKTPAYVPTHLAGAASGRSLGSEKLLHGSREIPCSIPMRIGVRVVNPQGARRR